MLEHVTVLAAASIVSAFGPVETKSFDPTGLDRIEVATGSGEVRVVNRDAKEVVVTAQKVRFGDECELSMERQGSRLIVESRRRRRFSSGQCRVDFEVGVPVRVDLSIATGSGKVKVDADARRVEVRVGSGSVEIGGQIESLNGRSGTGRFTVTRLGGDAEVRTGSGDIKLSFEKAPTGTVSLKTGSGDIELRYDDVPKSTSVDIKTGSGDATIYLPRSTEVQADLRAGSGRVRSDFPLTSQAGFRVSMKAGSGNLYLKRR